MLRICFLHCFFQWCELNRPNSAIYCLKSSLVVLAAPESINNVLKADDALLAQKFFYQHVIRYGQSLRFLLQVSTPADDVLEGLLSRCTPATIVLHKHELFERLGTGSDEGTIVDLLKTELLQNFLRLRCRVLRLLDAHDKNETICGYALIFRQMELLLVLRCSGTWSDIARVLARLEALILHVVALLLHVVGDEHFRH